jgi:hypothetical protein
MPHQSFRAVLSLHAVHWFLGSSIPLMQGSSTRSSTQDNQDDISMETSKVERDPWEAFALLVGRKQTLASNCPIARQRTRGTIKNLTIQVVNATETWLHVLIPLVCMAARERPVHRMMYTVELPHRGSMGL